MYKLRFLDQELISYRYSSCSCWDIIIIIIITGVPLIGCFHELLPASSVLGVSPCWVFCWGDLFKKSL